MNLLIGFVILLCLFCSEIRAAEVANDWWIRTILVVIVSMTVPGLALFQTMIVSKRLRNSDLPPEQSSSIVNRLSTCHSAVWLIASLAIVWAVRWQDVVRGNWNLDRWPLLDEAIILAPVVLSLVASWAIFFEVQQSISGVTGNRLDLTNIKQRVGYVSIRFRVYILMVLIPLSIAILSRDLAPWLETFSPLESAVGYFAAGLAVMAGFPFLLLLIWSNSKVEDDELRATLTNTCRQHRLFVYDVRVWKTGNRIVNALAAGVIPKFRIILLSDSLVNLFPKNELLAVVRHEAGHLRLWHLPIRIGFIVLPLVALATDEQNPLGWLNRLDELLVGSGLPSGAGVGLAMILYVLYLLISLSWLSHRLEYEADIYACQSDQANLGENDCPEISNSRWTIDPALAQDMSDALLRLAAVSPSQYGRGSIMHPSIQQRLLLIREIVESPEKARLFRSAFARRRRIVWVTLVAVCIMTLLV